MTTCGGLRPQSGTSWAALSGWGNRREASRGVMEREGREDEREGGEGRRGGEGRQGRRGGKKRRKSWKERVRNGWREEGKESRRRQEERDK